MRPTLRLVITIMAAVGLCTISFTTESNNLWANANTNACVAMNYSDSSVGAEQSNFDPVRGTWVYSWTSAIFFECSEGSYSACTICLRNNSYIKNFRGDWDYMGTSTALSGFEACGSTNNAAIFTTTFPAPGFTLTPGNQYKITWLSAAYDPNIGDCDHDEYEYYMTDRIIAVPENNLDPPPIIP